MTIGASSAVLIESDWNLKPFALLWLVQSGLVLIESDWNLKLKAVTVQTSVTVVLIESDWNLKIFEGAKDIVDEAEY